MRGSTISKSSAIVELRAVDYNLDQTGLYILGKANGELGIATKCEVHVPTHVLFNLIG